MAFDPSSADDARDFIANLKRERESNRKLEEEEKAMLKDVVLDFRALAQCIEQATTVKDIKEAYEKYAVRNTTLKELNPKSELI